MGAGFASDSREPMLEETAGLELVDDLGNYLAPAASRGRTVLQRREAGFLQPERRTSRFGARVEEPTRWRVLPCTPVTVWHSSL